MKKLSSLIIALFVLGLGTAFGQTAELNATADVFQAAEITEEAPLEFGIVETGTNPSIDFNTADAGVMLITGSIGENIFIQYPDQITLEDGSDQIFLETTAGTDLNTASSATAFTSEDSVELLDESGTGTIRLFVGGTLNQESDNTGTLTTPGNYSGSGTISVSYTSF